MGKNRALISVGKVRLVIICTVTGSLGPNKLRATYMILMTHINDRLLKSAKVLFRLRRRFRAITPEFTDEYELASAYLATMKDA